MINVAQSCNTETQEGNQEQTGQVQHVDATIIGSSQKTEHSVESTNESEANISERTQNSVQKSPSMTEELQKIFHYHSKKRSQNFPINSEEDEEENDPKNYELGFRKPPFFNLSEDDVMDYDEDSDEEEDLTAEEKTKKIGKTFENLNLKQDEEYDVNEDQANIDEFADNIIDEDDDAFGVVNDIEPISKSSTNITDPNKYYASSKNDYLIKLKSFLRR